MASLLLLLIWTLIFSNLPIWNQLYAIYCKYVTVHCIKLWLVLRINKRSTIPDLSIAGLNLICADVKVRWLVRVGQMGSGPWILGLILACWGWAVGRLAGTGTSYQHHITILPHNTTPHHSVRTISGGRLYNTDTISLVLLIE